YLQNGIYRFNGKWKQRGFGKLESKDIEHLDTIQRNGRLYYKLRLLRGTRLRSSIIQNRLSEIGKIKPITREINLNADRKRFWLGTIRSIDDRVTNDSLPLSLNHFDMHEI
ncbi:MAG: DNA polymerase, partial [Nitrososphaerales archaeon]